MFLFRAPQALARSFSPLILQRVFAQGLELAAQGLAFLFGGLSAPRAFGELVVGLASGLHEALDLLTELARRGVGGFSFQQGQFVLQFLGFGFDVRQTGLAVFGMNSVIRAQGIGHQHSTKFFAEDALGHEGVPVAVEVEIAQIIIAAVPDPKGLAILTPGSFIAMRHWQGPDFVSQVFIQGATSPSGLPLEAIGAGRDEG